MSIKTEYRMHFDSQDGSAESSLEIAASGGPDDLSIFLSQPSRHEALEWIIQMTRQEALELKAILGVLTSTANHEEEVTVGVA
jgi:hypothetical protein